MTLGPALVLALWAAGVAAGGALVASRRIVGPGFLRVVGGTVALFGTVTALVGGGRPAIVGTLAGGLAIVVASRTRPAIGVFAVSAAAFGVAAARDSSLVLVATGVVLLGGVTTEMLLGHWYLVDPRLPRRPLAILVVVAGAGLAAELAAVAAAGVGGADPVFLAADAALAGFTALLLAGVWFSLREPAYSGVMAATGLSYLAVLTSFGVVTLGRALVAGTLGTSL